MENKKTMKQELIDLAIKHKFSSKFLYQVAYKYSTKENLRYLFWMTELQQWLREVYNINVESNYLPNISKYRSLYKPMNIKASDFKTAKDWYNAVDKYYGKTNYDTYEEALESGLLEALKLIK